MGLIKLKDASKARALAAKEVTASRKFSDFKKLENTEVLENKPKLFEHNHFNASAFWKFLTNFLKLHKLRVSELYNEYKHSKDNTFFHKLYNEKSLGFNIESCYQSLSSDSGVCVNAVKNNVFRMCWLIYNGLDYDNANGTYKFYKGKDLYAEVLKNPYTALMEITGIGFSSADQFAKNIGIKENDPRRSRAYVLYLIKERCFLQGHLFLPYDDIEDLFKEHVARSDKEFEKVYNELKSEGLIKVVNYDGSRIIYPKFLYECEMGVTKTLIQLSEENCGKLLDNSSLKEEISFRQKRDGIILSDEQVRAIELANNNAVTIITGGPGTGKSTIIKYIYEIYKGCCETALCSPTGKASARANEILKDKISMTIHRLLKGTPLRDFQHNVTNKLPFNIIIIDEISMVDIVLMYDLLCAVKEGTRLVLVGDVDQLPSVGPGLVLKDMINSERFCTYYLTKIYRQKKGSITENCKRIKNNEKLEFVNDKESDMIFYEENDDEEVFIKLIDLYMKLAAKYDVSELQILSPMRKKDNMLSTFNINNKIKELMYKGKTSNLQDQFRIGDKVIQLKNNYTTEVFNGEMGKINAVNPSNIIVDFSGKLINYSTFDAKDNLDLSFATTIHKYQGSEGKIIIIPIAKCQSFMLRKNLIYTAFSRAKTKLYVIGSKNELIKGIKNIHTDKRNSLLELRLKKP